MWSFDERYAAEPASVGRARRELGDYAADLGSGAVDVGAVRLAVSEAVTNAVMHGYRGGPGAVRVAAAVLGDALTVAVSDRGVGVQAPNETPGLGCGLEVIAELADGLSVRDRARGGTKVRMGFALSAMGSRPAQRALAAA